MKKRIKTRRLTNIYHSNDDDVGMAIMCYPSLSLSLSLSLLVPLPLPKTAVSSQQSECAKIFEHDVWVALAIDYCQKRISLTLLLL